MENKEIDGQAIISEEVLETDSGDSGVDGSSVVEESADTGGSEFDEGSQGGIVDDGIAVDSGNVSGGNGSDIEGSGNDLSENIEQSNNDESARAVSDVIEDYGLGEVYDLENPLPVVIVEEEPVQEELDVFSLTGTYPGTISETYLDYFRGIVQKLGFNEHYLVYRSGQYSYTMVYGEDISESEGRFTGTGNTVTIYRDSDSYNSNYYTEFGEDTVSISTDSLFIYSDLGQYATLKEGVSGLEATTILFAVGFAVVYSVCHDIFDYIMEKVYRK